MFHLRNFDHHQFPDLCKQEFEAILQDEYSQLSSFRRHKKEIKHGNIQTKIFVNLDVPASNKMITYMEQQTNNKLEPINPNHLKNLAQRRNHKRYKEAKEMLKFFDLLKKSEIELPIDPIDLSLLMSDVYNYKDFLKKFGRNWEGEKERLEKMLKEDFDAASVSISTDTLKELSQTIIDLGAYLVIIRVRTLNCQHQ